ncbi:TonB-dependent receptor [Rubrolithibacter danxiaensis]|uniref:TonB-dependent receptor n=1 Tax=Rubrolithibacter danxiaensis TaxID=3390805 RepID=UPI003BF87142
MKHFILLCLLIAFQHKSFAQTNAVRGNISDAQTHEPLFGASIRIQNTNEGTLSDRDGNFSISSNSKFDTIIISSTGYYSKKLSVFDKEMQVLLSPAVNSLKEVVVSANREQRNRKEIPLAIDKIKSSTIKDTKATALYQLLNKVSGVYMVNLGNEQHTMAIRQPITYNALYLYLEDGLPIRPTGIFNHNALYEINMNEVKDIEVIKGPASSLYGSNAIGGAINFISQRPVSQSGHFSLQGDTHHYYRTDARGSFTAGKLGVFLSGYAAHQENSWQDYTDFDKYSGTVKTTYDINSTTHLTFTGTYNYLNTQTPGNLDSARFYNHSYGSNQRFTYRKVSAFRASSRVDHSWNSCNSTFLTAFFRDNSTGQLPSYYIQDIRNTTGQYMRSAGQENNQSFNSYGFLLQHSSRFNFLNSQLIAGFYLDNSPSSYRADFLTINKDISRNYYTGYTNTDSLIDNYKIRLFNTAAYMQYEINPTAPLHIVAGLRYDRVIYNFRNNLPIGQTKYKQEEKNNFNVLAPKIGATYDLGKGAGVYTNFSIGFQPPETSTLYGSRQLTPLKQAVFYNYEFGGWIPLLDQKVNLQASLYAMRGKNEIISILMPDNTTQNQNAGTTQHLGVEYTITYSPSAQFQFRFSGTNARHTYVEYSEVSFGKTATYNGNRMTNAPAWIVNSEIMFKPAFVKGFRSSVEWQRVGEYYINSANSKTYNGYDVFNLRLGYDLKKNQAKGVGIWLNALNLTDKLYATTVTANQYGVTYNAAPPRTVTLGLSYTLPTRTN